MRDQGLATLLALAGFLGFAGLHRFYLGKPVTGIIWFLTYGLFGIGTVFDLINMGDMVREANHRALPPGHQAALPPAYGTPYAQPHYGHQPYPYGQQPYPGAAPAPAPQAQPGNNLKDTTVDLELRVLQLARQQNGRLTTPIAAAELGISMAEAEEKLGEIASHGHANVDITEDGVVVYDFPGLRVS